MNNIVAILAGTAGYSNNITLSDTQIRIAALSLGVTLRIESWPEWVKGVSIITDSLSVGFQRQSQTWTVAV